MPASHYPRFIVSLGLVAASMPSFAQDYPSKPIRIVTAAAGGGSDFVARLLAQGISGPLGQPVVVENRGTGMLAGEVAARAPADGYNLTVQGGAFWIGPLLRKAPYDPIADFTPVSLIVREVNVLAVNPDVPARTVAELITWAKQQSGKLTFSSSGIGNPQQLTGELFNRMAGVKIIHVPYKGAAPQIADVVGKHITMTFVSIGAALPFIESGRLRAIGVTSSTRVSALPNVPPISDTPGLAGFEVINFFGLMLPAGTPPAIVKTLNGAAVAALKVPEIVAKLRENGFEPSPTTPDQFREFIRAESTKFGKIVVEAGVKAEQ